MCGTPTHTPTPVMWLNTWEKSIPKVIKFMLFQIKQISLLKFQWILIRFVNWFDGFGFGRVRIFLLMFRQWTASIGLALTACDACLCVRAVSLVGGSWRSVPNYVIFGSGIHAKSTSTGDKRYGTYTCKYYYVFIMNTWVLCKYVAGGDDVYLTMYCLCKFEITICVVKWL